MTEDEIKTFQDKLIRHAEMCLKRKNSCLGEEACKQGLILPFIALLGYDVFDTNEVNPEYSADFSDKYKNRVDYAIMKNKEAVIAIECKQSIEKNDRGQLKSYFNACKSIKLGILTDGIAYEFFADCDSPNMMDDEPFLKFNLNDFVNRGLDFELVKAISTFAKSEFDPDNVGAEAKKKVIFSSIINFLEKSLNNPDEDFIRYLLSKAEGINQKITRKIIEDNYDNVKTAFMGFIDKRILDRVGLADKRLIKFEEKKEDIPECNIQNTVIPQDIVTTENETYAYEYAKQRLAFLVTTDELYQGLQYIKCEDLKTTFMVYYKKVRNGKLFNFTENKDGIKTFFFPLINVTLNCTDNNDYKELDAPLLESYIKAFENIK